MPEIAGKVADGFAEAVRENEERWLSPLAVRSYETRGRENPEEECRLRTPFQRDRDRIVHSKAFRRLRFKTQVFIDPEGDHFRTRLTHTLEAAGIARGVARGLRLNEDLTEAIAVGHDLGHPPFGHAGEQALDEILRERGAAGFRHNGPVEPETQEGRIVRLVDRFAYINHDIDDALRAGLLEPADLPAEPIELLGDSGSRRIDTLVHDLVETSAVAGDIVQSNAVGEAMLDLRSFMFERVYLQQDHLPAQAAVRRIFEELVGERGMSIEDATDYLAGMTDRFALTFVAELG
jgi:dGTPase